MSPIPTDPAGTFADIGVVNHNQDGDETLEVWLRQRESPSAFADAIMAVRRADYDAAQPRMLPDFSGNGEHLYFGEAAQRDVIFGDGPFRIGKKGVIGKGINGTIHRRLGFPNTDQQCNVGAVAAGTIRWTLNFTIDFSVAATQGLADQGYEESPGSLSWGIGITATDLVELRLADATTDVDAFFSTVPLSSVLASWDDAWIRITLDFDADTVVYEWSTDGLAWVQLGAAVSSGGHPALFQPDDTIYVDIAQAANTEPLVGGAVFSILVEENGAPVWSWDGETDGLGALIAINDVAQAQDPTVDVADLRFDGVDDAACLFERSGVAGGGARAAQFDVAPGEALTIVFVGAIDSVAGGGANGKFDHWFAKKNNGASNEAGYAIENERDNAWFEFRVSDGADQDGEGVQLTMLANGELAATVYEIDGPGGEIRVRELGEASVDTAYADQGTGSPPYALRVGHIPFLNGAAFCAMDFVGMAVWKRLLTATERAQVAAFLSEAP